MSASLTDKITDVRNAARPNSARVSGSRSPGGATLSCDNLTGWPIASKVHFVTYSIDSNSDPIAGTQLDCSGIRSGNTITSLTVIDGADNGNSVNDVVEMLPTAAWGQDLADALTKEHDRTGFHTAAAIVTIGNVLWPVGSIYTNASVATNPATLLGFGTWTAFGGGRVPVGVGTSDQAFAVGDTGGESNHTLSAAESGSPAHTHTTATNGTPGVGAAGKVGIGTSSAVDTFTTGANTPAAAANAHNNLQPYIVVYMWKRTA